MTLICFRIVAPSLVMTVSPEEVMIILSMPLGPREVRTQSETAAEVLMLRCRRKVCSNVSSQAF